MENLNRELYRLFQDIVDQRDAAELASAQTQSTLGHAQETITLLEAEIAAIKSYCEQALGTIADAKQGIFNGPHTEDNDDDPAARWIGDFWLSTPNNADLLGEAEKEWLSNIPNPQKALNLTTETLKRRIVRSDRIKCLLFVSAITLASGQTEDSCAYANLALKECANDWRHKKLAGIAHYLRGRFLLEVREFRQAYWDFCLAISMPGYHDKVKFYRDYAESRVLCEDEDDSAPAVKTESVLSSPTTPHVPST